MKKILRSALAILVVSAIAATFSACGPEDANDNIPVDTPAVGEPVSTAPLDASQPVDSALPEVTTVFTAEDPALATTVDTLPPLITSTEETTVSTPAATEKTTEKTEKKTEKTTKKTEKTEKATEADKDTEPEDGSRLPDEEGDEEIDLEWEDIDIDEWLDMMGVEDGGEEVPDIDVNE